MYQTEKESKRERHGIEEQSRGGEGRYKAPKKGNGGRKGERVERKWSLPIEVKEPLVCLNKVTFQLSLVQSL